MSSTMRNSFRGLVALALTALTGGCAPSLFPVGARDMVPEVTENALVMADGARLPLHRWMPEKAPRAIIVGVHGFNDYGNAFAIPAATWVESGLAVYAYDQRGFGATEAPGLWAGVDAMVDDLAEAVAAIGARHPGVPLHVVGVSMGGAVTMTALAENRLPTVESTVLVAPAVWGRRTISAFRRSVLWLSRNTVPWLKLTGRGLKITPSDNIAMLRALGADPLVIKETRVDAIAGLVDLMDAALDSSSTIDAPLLVLYGARDEIIPKEPTEEMLCALTAPRTVAVYGEGYHMLLRDLQAEVVHRDIAAWIFNADGDLPSGDDAVVTDYFGC
jgi:alpha-beta hydrolase superfamily lysophospholipase